MLDQIEMWEESAERTLDDMAQPDGRLKCFCGELFEMKDACQISPNPWSPPACPKCYERAMKEWEKQKKEHK